MICICTKWNNYSRKKLWLILLAQRKLFILWNHNTKHCSARILFNFVKLNNCQINWHWESIIPKTKEISLDLRKKNEKKTPCWSLHSRRWIYKAFPSVKNWSVIKKFKESRRTNLAEVGSERVQRLWEENFVWDVPKDPRTTLVTQPRQES